MLQSEERARELRREYLRIWRARNRDKIREYNRLYWERKALAEMGVKSNNATKNDKS